MKFKLKQEKFEELLEKLIVKDIFPSCAFSVNEGVLVSKKKEEHGRAIRWVKFEKSYFEEIDDSVESIEIDVDRTLNFVKNIPAGTTLIVETIGNKLSISRLILDKDGKENGKRGVTKISFKEAEAESDKFPFEMKEKKYPVIGKDKIVLDVNFNIKLEDFKSLSEYAGSLKTEFYKFNLKDNKILVRVGDLHDFSDYTDEYPQGEIKKGDGLEITLSYGIPQVASTFRKEYVDIKAKDKNNPVWISEKGKGYIIGVLLPPYIESD